MDSPKIAEQPGQPRPGPGRPARARRPVLVRFSGVLLRVPRYLRLAYRLIRDDRLAGRQRALAAAGAAYLLSPIDPIPGIIPVLGQLDDLAVLLLSLRRALRSCPPAVAAEHLERTGLTLAQIDADLATLRATAVWIAARAGQLVGRAAGRLARAGRRRAAGALARLGDKLRQRLNSDVTER